MKYLAWLLKAVIFFVLFAFALNNQDAVVLHLLSVSLNQRVRLKVFAADDDMPMGDMKHQAMMIMIDPRIMYSDVAEISANGQGIVLAFSQSAGPSSQPLTVSRVGMSREQAQAVMGLLHQALWNMDNPSQKRLSGGADQPHD